MDREKVIKGLETCIPMKYETNEEKECRHEQCPYGRENYKPMNGCFWDLMSDALALLKEQEAKTGHWISVNDGDVVAIDNDGFPERACFCSECKKYLIASDEYAVYGKYCPFCGAKMEGSVKWE